MMVGRQRQYNRATANTSRLFYATSGAAQHKQPHNSWGMQASNMIKLLSQLLWCGKRLNM
jgi:hypothetical protein